MIKRPWEWMLYVGVGVAVGVGLSAMATLVALSHVPVQSVAPTPTAVPPARVWLCIEPGTEYGLSTDAGPERVVLEVKSWADCGRGQP